MFTDSLFAVPRGSFQRPVPLVLVDPCDMPDVTISVRHEWIPYMLGALKQLVLQATWDTDDPDALNLVQQRAMTLLSCVGVGGGGGGPVLTFRQLDDCTLQVSSDSGVTWLTIFNAATCVSDGINDAIDKGKIRGGGQQPAGGRGVSGVCYDYTVTLNGNDRWLAPLTISEFDTIEVTLANGAWWDGDIGQAWKCPEGVEFILGTCNEISHNLDIADPLPTLYHMRLMGNVVADTTTPYVDMWDTSYSIPSGIPDGQFYLQANDSVLADNQGTITFHVRICKNPGGGWCLNWLSGKGIGDWVSPVNLEGHVAGFYDSATDTVTATSIGPSTNWASMGIALDSVTVTHISVTYEWAGDAGDGADICINGTAVQTFVQVTPGLVTFEWFGSAVATEAGVVCPCSGAGRSATIRNVQITAVGTKPTGGTDC